MFDEYLLFSDEQDVATDAWCDYEVDIHKSNADGLRLELVAISCGSASGSAGRGGDTLLARVMAKDVDAGWSTTPSATIDDMGCFPLIFGNSGVDANGSTRVFHTVRTNKRYLKVYYDITDSSGSAGWECTGGVVSGFQRDA
jgi:hypothetical protein